MKKIILLLGLLLSSCVTTYKVSNNGEYSKFKCLQPKQKMFLLRTYNTCPLFSSNPSPESSVWKLFFVTDANRKYLEESNDYEGKVLQHTKNCTLPTRVTISRVIGVDQRINISEIVKRSDSQSAENLFLIGNLYLNDKNYLISFQLEDGYGEKVEERIFKNLRSCGGIRN